MSEISYSLSRGVGLSRTTLLMGSYLPVSISRIKVHKIMNSKFFNTIDTLVGYADYVRVRDMERSIRVVVDGIKDSTRDLLKREFDE